MNITGVPYIELPTPNETSVCCSQKQVNIIDIIESAYTGFGFITNVAIERLRVKHRLRVVQTLEDTVMRNTLRTVGPDCILSEEDLKVGSASDQPQFLTVFRCLPFPICSLFLSRLLLPLGSDVSPVSVSVPPCHSSFCSCMLRIKGFVVLSVTCIEVMVL